MRNALKKKSPQLLPKSSPPKRGAPSNSPPRLIQKALERIPAYVESPSFRYGRTTGDRAMRSERRGSHRLLLLALVNGSALQYDGAVVAVDPNGTARPITAAELGERIHRTRKCVQECFADLLDMGLLVGTRQLKLLIAGGLQVSGVVRAFTRKFWVELGLWGLYVESVKWAAANGRLKFRMTFKKVRLEKQARRRIQDLAGGLCGLAPDAEEYRRRNMLGIEAVNCHERNPRHCPKMKPSEEVCDICRKMGCNR